LKGLKPVHPKGCTSECGEISLGAGRLSADLEVINITNRNGQIAVTALSVSKVLVLLLYGYPKNALCEEIDERAMLVAAAEEDCLNFRWHVAHFMLAARAGIAPGMTVPAHSLTVSMWSSVIVSVSAGGDGGRKMPELPVFEYTSAACGDWFPKSPRQQPNRKEAPAARPRLGWDLWSRGHP
jgi:hypothetical protein